MIRTRSWKYVHRYPYGPNELYDIKNDPYEDENLINDDNKNHITKELRSDLGSWFNRYVSPAYDGIKEPVTGAGQINLVGNQSKGSISFIHRFKNTYGRS
jgi:hypothetical protein